MNQALPESPADPALLRYTADIVAAHVRRNQVPVAELAALIQAVHAALGGVTAPDTPADTALTPAVPIKRSVFPDYIVCLEDGKQMKTLKRHLHAAYGLTPDAYRERWVRIPVSCRPAFREILAHHFGAMSPMIPI